MSSPSRYAVAEASGGKYWFTNRMRKETTIRRSLGRQGMVPPGPRTQDVIDPRIGADHEDRDSPRGVCLMRILILGATGMLGHSIHDVLSHKHDVVSTTRSSPAALPVNAGPFFDKAG